MKKTLFFMLALVVTMQLQATRTRNTFTFNVQRPHNATAATKCPVSQAVTGKFFGVTGDLSSYLGKSSMTNLANYFNSKGEEKFYKGYTASPYGHWFTSAGMATNKEKSYCLKVTYSGGNYLLEHDADNTQKGDSYTVREALVYSSTKDTLIFVFNVTLGDKSSVETDQPDFYARKNVTDDWLIRPYTQKNSEAKVYENFIQVHVGDKIVMGGDIKEPATWSLDLSTNAAKPRWYQITWKSKKESTKAVSKYIDQLEFTLTESATTDMSGRYVLKARFTDKNGKKQTVSYYYYVDVQEETAGTFHTWRTYSELSYNFRSEYPDLKAPTKVHSFKKSGGKKAANYYAGEWWSCFWGDKLNPIAGTDSATIYGAAKNMVAQYERDFAYIRDSMGWPPDLSARKGYKSIVYIFGSGLNNDSESQDTKGGYQSSTSVDGSSWACVWASYYPFSRFRDDADKQFSDGEYQRNAMIHEGIHAIFADLGACQGSSWFHEGGNTWLQGQVYARRDGVHGDAGYLDGGPFLAPHMPIECYSGWLQDGSYGGPAAQGVNMYNSSGSQVCTWRKYLGGVQYANAFPTVIANVCGDGVIPWIWRYCKNRVLETMGDSIGDTAMREIITQYRARQALFDLGGWDKTYRNVAEDYFGTEVGAEWSPYWIDCPKVKLTPYQSLTINDADGWMAPDTLTNPGWSGGNQIPIHVNSNGGICEVDFRPEDTNMQALLCYRTKEGKCYYSHPVQCGTMSIDLSMKPANNVIFCVIANTDYIYTGDAQRKHHWDYRLRLGKNAWQIADIHQKWFLYEKTVTDPNYDATDIEQVELGENISENESIVQLTSGNIHVGDRIFTNLNGVSADNVSVRIVGLPGVVVKAGKLNYDGSFDLPTNIPAGFYVISFNHGEKKDVFKVVVK